MLCLTGWPYECTEFSESRPYFWRPYFKICCLKPAALRPIHKLNTGDMLKETYCTARANCVDKLNENTELLKENKRELDKISGIIAKEAEQRTYASVAATGQRQGQPLSAATALHSIVVKSKDEQETGDEVVEKIREVVNATEEGIRIDRIRKARERKVIIGCRYKEEINKIKEKIGKAGDKLSVQEIENKDPLIIVKDVLSCHKDEDILRAIRRQNKNILDKIEKSEDRMEIRYRKRARNPLMMHVVVKVSPQIWALTTEAGALHIDVQRVRVEDQSPLVQCSRCLGYGHGRRFCRVSLDVCSHCGGQHLRSDCPDWTAAVQPTCCNCQKAKMTDTSHNAFSRDCPVRKRWDTLARSAIAYC
ncbi:hypothetical protein O3G_MSEX015240 [Manduca sexta]|uniref:Gag-like protein n=1 Tax=Manduca sexta TaxID=7130 RepID=A0A921ZWT5_MANSE|nr:hypothetical protein O3G_MSEX015240 [Manduca sexta]